MGTLGINSFFPTSHSNYMSKRKASGSTLTGGTGDYNPQTYSVQIDSTVGDYKSVQYPTPVPRFGTSGTSSTVMEVLRVIWILDDIPTPAGQYGLTVSLSTAALDDGSGSTIRLVADPRTFAFFSFDGIFATAAGFAYSSRVFDQNLSDGSGRGILVATDSFFVNVGFQGTAGTTSKVAVKIYYRLKNITLQEYVGIVQSQQ